MSKDSDGYVERDHQLFSLILGATLAALFGAVYFAMRGNPVFAVFTVIGMLGVVLLLPGPGGKND